MKGCNHMTRDEYIDDIKLSLGAPVVEVEIQEMLGKIVDMAFREIKRYIVDTRFVTVPYSKGPIDLKKYKVDSVIQLFRTANPSRVADFTDIYSLATVSQSNATSSVNLLMSDYLYRTQLNQLKSTMTTDLDFTYDKEERKLYVNTFYPKPINLTIVYVPEFKDVSDVKEDYWVNYIRRLSLALAKETLGRVRGKYELSSSLYKLDGGTLLSEGIAERDAIRAELNENSDIVFPMD